MIIFVTGGAGFIGSNFLNLMVPRHPSHSFVNLDKLTYAANLLNLREIEALPNYAFQQVDIGVRDEVVAVFERFRPDWVIHFAAESHVDRSILGPDAFVQTNVVGTVNLLEACRKCGFADGSGGRLFHHVSTDEVYGSLGPAGSFSEQSRYDPSSPYSASKAASDHFVRAYHRTYGMPVKITNCSNNYGPSQFPEKLIPLTILNALDGNPLPVYGQGANVRDWLFVADHCEAIWKVASEGRVGETYNIGGGEERSNIDVVHSICRIVADISGKECRDLERLITFVKDRPGHDFRYAIDDSKLRAELGWKPQHTFEIGLRETVQWYLDHRDWVDSVRSGEYRQWLCRNYRER
jgi:dTDP-glucose 4,6-dehydratase